MKKILFTIFLISITFCTFSQDVEKTNREQDPSQMMQISQLALEMVNYGYAYKSSLSLIEAATIIAEHPFQNLVPAQSEASTGEDGEKVKKIPEITVEKLLADATEFATDQTILYLIQSVNAKIEQKKTEHVATKGRYYGPARLIHRVYGNSSYTDYIKFTGGLLAEIAAIGDGDTDLDLYVYDENGNFIKSDTDYTDNCYVSFYPKWTGLYKVVVKNRGSVYNDYVLLTN